MRQQQQQQKQHQQQWKCAAGAFTALCCTLCCVECHKYRNHEKTFILPKWNVLSYANLNRKFSILWWPKNIEMISLWNASFFVCSLAEHEQTNSWLIKSHKTQQTESDFTEENHTEHILVDVACSCAIRLCMY